MLIGVDGRGRAAGDARLPDPKRADSHANPRLEPLHLRIHSPHEGVHIGPPLRGRLTIRKVRGWTSFDQVGIGVKIIINMDSVYVVTSYYIGYDVQGPAPRKTARRIHPPVKLEVANN
jgi:hypothetical protein